MRGGRKMPMMKKGGQGHEGQGLRKRRCNRRQEEKAAAKPAMTLASIRAAAKAKGYKLVKA